MALLPQPGIGFTIETDVYISCAAFVFTAWSYALAKRQFEHRLPKWTQLPIGLRSRMCAELSVIPVRLAMMYFTFPIVMRAFEPAERWTASDTEKSIISCSLMAGAYMFDLSVHRDEFLSIVHHCMGPGLLLWIRTSFSSFTPADALICRPLMMFTFFGASVGGTAASSAVLLLRVGKRYMDATSVHRCFVPSLLVLAVSTVLSCTLNVLYFLHVFDEAYAHFGLWLTLPAIWEAFECYLQWRWLLRLFNLEKKLFSKREQEPDKGLTTPSVSATGLAHSVFPSWIVPALKLVICLWAILMTLVFLKISLKISGISHSTGEIGYWLRRGNNLTALTTLTVSFKEGLIAPQLETGVID